MVAVGGVSMLNTMSILLASLGDPNGTIQIQQQSEMTSAGGCGGGSCCDPCCSDPAEAYIDPFEGISTSDSALLNTLVNLKWPRRDMRFYIRGGMILLRRLQAEQGGTTEGPLTGKDSEFSEEDLTEVENFLGTDGDAVLQLSLTDTNQAQIDSFAEGETRLAEVEAEALSQANIIFDDKPSFLHQKVFKKANSYSMHLNKGGVIFETASADFYKKYTSQITKRGINFLCLLPLTFDCEQEYLQYRRFEAVPCPNDTYRTQDGRCNNLYYRHWGASFTPARRDLPANYDDGMWTIRKSVTSGNPPLPSARLISTTINRSPGDESREWTMLHMSYGQFLDHDFISTPLTKGYDGAPVACCDNPDRFNCLPIDVPDGDSLYSCYNKTCMEFVRSAPFFMFCKMGARKQGNEQTAYIDGSGVYGATDNETNYLRTFQDGLLKVQVNLFGETLLPPEEDVDDGCNRPDHAYEDRYCFRSGDSRVNVQPLLIVFQTMWAREHNRLAKKLKSYHDDWDDETLFQEARRIVGAQIQQVTYNEFLPSIIGPTLMASSKLNPLQGAEYTTDYNEFVDASLANNFGTAAYRFGHSLIADFFLKTTVHGLTSPRETSSLFFYPFTFYQKEATSDIARGGLDLPQMQMDSFFTDKVAGKLFRSRLPYGLDLLALNIQRGRDHGLAPYVEWIEFCGGKMPASFDDLLEYMAQDRIDALQDVYEDVGDIDLYVGGVSETPLPGALVGFTFTCLLHSQFFRIKYGDRYWFEYKDSPYPFTPDQLKQLHKVTLARIMCDNMPELEYVQRWPLRNPGPDNPKVCCKSIRKYSLKPWNPNYHDGDDY